ncbi:asparagine synthase (glutamine-hydrolyzing) [Prescottella agglutinans]|uniref:asparagine synthase (glutamine-hydrolyzing) n=1 Tax=Prescottella agglutinans TaxID=1644129 RepID=A0ABT6M7M3_9NOCA|nr:asparagine synthase (glutamine-hydrolyzing) [Prescottella agglutinans]MDH6280302.1 asparagine synthase (glutamine-hydrolyzing) [Prescottella agglutinans]
MCGIALIIGDGAQPDVFDLMMAAIAGRGEVDERARAQGVLAGTQRLKIVDRARAVQPWVSADNRWMLCYNGEVFNHELLRDELSALGHTFRSTSDTEVVLEAFLEWGDAAVDRLRGEFAFAIVNLGTLETYIARDPIGVKPLYYSWRHGRLHIASEVKALVPVGAKVIQVPAGHHGWARTTSGPDLVPYFDLYADARRLGHLTDPHEATELIRSTLRDSIAVRVDTDLPVGVVLSGGLDSSLVLAQVKELHPDCVAFTIGTRDSEDLDYARRLTAELGVHHEVIELQPRQIGMREIREAIRIGELTEYGDVINAVVSVPLFRRVRELGIKVVLTGDGSDELFGGYPMYHEVDPAQGERLFAHRLVNLGRTELQRVDRASMGQGVETRVPFLDKNMINLAMRIPLKMKIGGDQEKWLVRKAFADSLPGYILNRPKSGMSYSSGLHDRARLFKPWFPRLHRSFHYDLCEPIRRDFDTVLTRVDNDLDLAIVDGAHRQDYTPFERGRDLAGAMRWNVQLATRQLLSRSR